MCSEERTNFQIALAKKVVTLTQGMDKDFQLRIFAEINKDLRMNRISAERGGKQYPQANRGAYHGNNSRPSGNGSEAVKPPSEKQIKYALALKITDPEKYNSKELSEAIKAAKEAKK